MARSNATIRRIEATLQDIRDNPARFLDQTVWVLTLEVIDAHHPENPRAHDEDVPKIFKSLLWFGWGEVGISFNPYTGRITGGHGRSMAARLGMEQDLDAFEKQWERWLKEDPARRDIAEIANQRFQPGYWERVPLTICGLTEIDQKTLMVRLNDTKSDGRDDPARMAAVLAQLPKASIELTGWSPQQADAFKAAFIERAPEPDPEPDAPDLSGLGEGGGYNFDSGDAPEGTEYEGKERFERPDATDYSGTDWGDNDATNESGPVSVTGADGQQVRIAQVDTSGVDESVKAENVVYDSSVRETRAVLLMSYAQLEEFKLAFGKTTANPGPIPFILERLGHPVNMAQSIKEWRPDANLEVLRLFMAQHSDLVQEWEQLQLEKQKTAENPDLVEEE